MEARMQVKPDRSVEGDGETAGGRDGSEFKGEGLFTVCGRRIMTGPAYAFPTPHQGGTIYFCTEFCLWAFEADPERFYTAHSRNAAKLRGESAG